MSKQLHGLGAEHSGLPHHPLLPQTLLQWLWRILLWLGPQLLWSDPAVVQQQQSSLPIGGTALGRLLGQLLKKSAPCAGMSAILHLQQALLRCNYAFKGALVPVVCGVPKSRQSKDRSADLLHCSMKKIIWWHHSM